MICRHAGAQRCSCWWAAPDWSASVTRAFYGLAAYTVYLVTPARQRPVDLASRCRPRWSSPVLRRCVVGALSLRTRGFFFLMVTLAFGQMMFFVFHDTKLGGGTDGAFLARPAAVAVRLGAARSVPAPAPMAAYYVSLGAAGWRCIWAWSLLLRSLFGRVLAGHPRQRAPHAGARLQHLPLQARGLHASPACWRAWPGHMWAMHRGFVNPELIGWHRVRRGAADDPARRHQAHCTVPSLARSPSPASAGHDEWKPFATVYAIGREGRASAALSERQLLVEGV